MPYTKHYGGTKESINLSLSRKSSQSNWKDILYIPGKEQEHISVHYRKVVYLRGKADKDE